MQSPTDPTQKKNGLHNMKGVILAGGRATRLHPLTLVTNKHLLPIYDKPIIYYAIEKLVSAGIERIMIVTSPYHVDDFVNLLGSGQNFISKKSGKQIQIVYGIQNAPVGLANGLCIAKDYVGPDNCTLCLGDNVFEDDVSTHIKNFSGGNTIFLTQVPDPERFGVATLNASGGFVRVDEKPKKPKSNWAVTGLYIFDNTVFDKMIGQPLSARGEQEITYLINKYGEEKAVQPVFLKKKWFDVGTFDSLISAGEYMRKKAHKK